MADHAFALLLLDHDAEAEVAHARSNHPLERIGTQEFAAENTFLPACEGVRGGVEVASGEWKLHADKLGGHELPSLQARARGEVLDDVDAVVHSRVPHAQ